MCILLISTVRMFYPVLTVSSFLSSITSSLSSSSTTFVATERRYSLPGLNKDSYAVLGDINIGALMSVTTYPIGFECSTVVRSDMWVLQYMEAVAFAVQMINKDPTLLPNVTLGFVNVDYCRTPNIALAQSLAFLPRRDVSYNKTVCSVKNSSLSEDSNQASNADTAGDVAGASAASLLSYEPLPHYDVVGVLGPQGSSSTIPISSLFSVARLPVVSYMATSDELSSIYDHPYFLRLVPPDRHQTLAMLTFIADNGWSYISVLYGDTSYGTKAFDNIRQQSHMFGICVATSQSVNIRTNFYSVLDNLLKYDRARVVVLFIDTDQVLSLLDACSRAGVRDHFIWIGSDSISDKTVSRRKHWDLLNGAFTFMYYSKRVPEFDDYFRKLRPGSTSNPWFDSYWEVQARCSFKNKNGSCLSQESVKSFEQLPIQSSVSLVIDSVLTFGHALHKLLSNVCQGITGKDARACVKGEILLAYMLNISFEGFTGKISFDKNGDVIGKYEIRQFFWENEELAHDNAKRNLLEVPIAYFEISKNKITYTDHPISWRHLNVLPRIVPVLVGVAGSDSPESVCSRPCVVGEYRISNELKCCWECRKCRDNERLINRSTACATCGKFTWPDPRTNFTTCLSIPLAYASFSDTLSVIEVCLAVTAIVSQGFVVVSYIYFRDHRVIKAASRELSILQMVAIFVGYITVILFQTMPTDTTCAVIYFMFCLSFAWLYSPLIVKAVRIYRIFRNSAKCNRRPRCVSPQSQLVMAGMLIAVQICLCVATYILYHPAAKVTQPVDTEKFVELSCDLTLPGLASFLTYNLFLVTVCSALAFKTRKLPDNFNESRFMSMCVSTTLVVWIAFVPTYFTASKEYYRVLLLSAALLINHTVALVFLFLPKVYAAVYVASESLAISRFHTNGSTLTPHLPVVSNRISPAVINPP